MQWAIIARAEWFTDRRLIVPPKKIAEALVPAAVAQGWIVLARDSDVPAPSRLRRISRRAHGYGDAEDA